MPSGTATSATNFTIAGQTVDEVYISASANGTVAGIAYTGADILHYDRAGNAWAMTFDASDVGLNVNVGSFTFLPDGSILLALAANATLPGVGKVTTMDVVRFVPSQLGPDTVGYFQWYFDGSDVGLSTTAEKMPLASSRRPTAAAGCVSRRRAQPAFQTMWAGR